MTASGPLISVIVPIYNSEKYLEKCIDSLLCQTYENLEILLMENGSSDSSGEICDAFEKKDARIRVFHTENNGQAGARNTALNVAKGEYIGFVDSDDTIAPDMYEKLFDAFLKYDCDISVCGRYNVEEISGEKKAVFSGEKAEKWDQEESLRRFLTWNRLDGSPCDKLFKREMIGEIRFPLGLICEDIPFVYEILKKAKSVVHVGDPLYYYLQRKGSTSHSSVSEKTFGLVKYPAKVREDVIKNHPERKSHADYYYFSRELIFIRKLLQDVFKKEAKERMAIICKAPLLTNPLFSRRQKLDILLIKTKLYLLAYKYHSYRKEKRK